MTGWLWGSLLLNYLCLTFSSLQGGRHSPASRGVEGPRWVDTGKALRSGHGGGEKLRHAGCCHDGHPRGHSLKALCFRLFTHPSFIFIWEFWESKVPCCLSLSVQRLAQRLAREALRPCRCGKCRTKGTRKRNKCWSPSHSSSKRQLLGECKMLSYPSEHMSPGDATLVPNKGWLRSPSTAMHPLTPLAFYQPHPSWARAAWEGHNQPPRVTTCLYHLVPPESHNAWKHTGNFHDLL